MNKMIKNVVLLVAITVVASLIPLFWAHDAPIEVTIPQLDAVEMAAQKEAAQQAEKQAQREARARRVYACQSDEDCIIVEKDPCGCAVGPKGVAAINVNFVTDFNTLNSKQITTACPDTISTEKECSAEAQAVCQARTCKITY